MSAASPTRRGLLATSAASGAVGLLFAHPAAADSNAIRPFRVSVPEAELADLRRRVLATRWPGDGERLTGAYALGPKAGEWLQQATLAIRARVPLELLRDTIQPFPTFSEIYVAALKALHGRITAARGPGAYGARAGSRAGAATAV